MDLNREALNQRGEDDVRRFAGRCALVPPPVSHTVVYYGVLSAHHGLRSAVVPCAEEPAPEAKQLALFVPRGHLELPATPTLLEAQLRDAAPSRLSWMTLLARVFRIDISVCARCSGPMRVTRFVVSACLGFGPGGSALRFGPAFGPLCLRSPSPISFRLNA